MKILPLGDSLTLGVSKPCGHSFGGYRWPLFRHLTQAGISFQFVGTRRSGPPQFPQKEHEGHPGWRIDQIEDIVSSVLTTCKPDLILLMIGSNDLHQNFACHEAPQRLAHLLETIVRHQPNVHICLSTIPLAEEVIFPGEKRLTYNHALTELVKQWKVRQRKIQFIDAGKHVTLSDLYDGVHPLESGYEKIASEWFTAVRELHSREF